MSTAPTINHPSYHSDYLALREQLAAGSPAWLDDLRAAAWDSFRQPRAFPRRAGATSRGSTPT